MITKFVLNFSLFVSFVTFVYCLINGISVNECIFRSLVVFTGNYVITILFFILLRMLLNPGNRSSQAKEPHTEQLEPATGEGGASE